MCNHGLLRASGAVWLGLMLHCLARRSVLISFANCDALRDSRAFKDLHFIHKPLVTWLGLWAWPPLHVFPSFISNSISALSSLLPPSSLDFLLLHTHFSYILKIHAR